MFGLPDELTAVIPKNPRFYSLYVGGVFSRKAFVKEEENAGNATYFTQPIAGQRFGEGSTFTINGESKSEVSSNHYFYGRALGPDANPFIIDPQVGYPFGEHDKYTMSKKHQYRTLYSDPIIPDYVVWVYVSFDYKDENGREQKGWFSKRFLPDVKVITESDLKNTWKPIIASYVTKAQNNTAVQTLPGNIPVTHPGMDKMMFKIQKVISKL